MSQALIFDVETTGIDAPEIIEAAYIPIDITGTVIRPGGWCGRFKPSKPISLGAMATHGIMDEDLAECPPSSTFALPEGVEYLIGHNVDFDWKAIGEPDVKRICTLAMCRALWPDADSHTQSAMLYLLDRANAREALKHAHSAAADVMVCRTILTHIIAKAGPFADFEALWQASERMRVPTRMSFGKHKGELIRDIPRDYKAWLLRQADVDPYLAKALRAA